MEKKEKLEENMLYGKNEKMTLKKCINNELALIIFSLPLLIMGVTYNTLGLLGVLPLIFYPLFIYLIKYKKGKTIEGAVYLLHNGVLSLGSSFIFVLTGIEIILFLFEGRTRIILIYIAVMVYILIIFLCRLLQERVLKKKNVKKGNVKFSACIGAILGYFGARAFLKDIDQRKALELICFLCFSLSYISLLGIFNIFKYQNIEKWHRKGGDKL